MSSYLSVLYELHGEADGNEYVGEPHEHATSETSPVEALRRLCQPKGLADQAHRSWNDDIWIHH